jgi:hypothetical protein
VRRVEPTNETAKAQAGAPLWKPSRGSYALDREEARGILEEKEQIAKHGAKLRDGGCRWPERHQCRGDLEGAHIFEDKKMGGDHGRLSERRHIMTLCAWMHRKGPESIHGKQIKVEPMNEAEGADGPCRFLRDGKDGWYVVAEEIAIGRIARD